MSSPNTSGVREDSAFSRSWFSAAAPPTSEPAGSSERSRSMVAPVAGADASVVGIARVIVQPFALPAGIAAAIAASLLSTAAVLACSRGRGEDRQGAGRAGAEGVDDLVVAGAGGLGSAG